MNLSDYEIYILILCLIVFVMLSGFSAICIATIYRLRVSVINLGGEDVSILKEYDMQKRRKCSRLLGSIGTAIDRVFSVVLLFAFGIAFAFSLFVYVSEADVLKDLPTFRVVKTGSMSKVHEKNEYLNALGIDDQFQAMDLIVTHDLPPVEELELYDIVVYEVDDMLIVHRIVEIEPPNASHPDEYYFRLQGDAVESPDRFPVHYSQMRAIYSGERIRFVGSFVLFMQSPAGWLCILLSFGVALIIPLVEKRLECERWKRFRRIR